MATQVSSMNSLPSQLLTPVFSVCNSLLFSQVWNDFTVLVAQPLFIRILYVTSSFIFTFQPHVHTSLRRSHDWFEIKNKSDNIAISFIIGSWPRYRRDETNIPSIYLGSLNLNINLNFTSIDSISKLFINSIQLNILNIIGDIISILQSISVDPLASIC